MNEESLQRFYTKEEEFFEEFGYSEIVSTVRKAIEPLIWNPDYDFNDDTRKAN